MKSYFVCHSINGHKHIYPKPVKLSDCLYFYMQAENMEEVEYYCAPGEIVVLLKTFSNKDDARVYCNFLREKFIESLDSQTEFS